MHLFVNLPMRIGCPCRVILVPTLIATVLFLLATPCPALEPSVWWVFLSDRGPNVQSRLRAAEDGLRTLPSWERRASVGLCNADPLDLPPWEGYVDALREAGCTVRVRSRLLNAVSVHLHRADPRYLESLPFVREVRPVGRSVPPIPPDGGVPRPLQLSNAQLGLVNLDDVHSRGWTGEGVTVGILDSGFDLVHPAFSDVSVLDQWDFLEGDPDPSQQPGDPPGQSEHGTAVLSLLGGYQEGVFHGGAPDAEFLLAKTEDTSDEYPQEEDLWVEGLEWLEQGGAWIVSNSLGYIDWYGYQDLDGNTAVTTVAADLAASRGLMVFSAIGNRGPSSGTLIAPADGDSVFSVGAVNSLSQIADFSSRGPTSDGRTKPEACGLGVSAVVVSGTGTGYRSGSGTSFATPLASSCALTLLQAHPEWNVFDCTEALKATAGRSGNPDCSYGWGVLDVLAALRYESVTGVARWSDSGSGAAGYPLSVQVADTQTVVTTNDLGWFAVDPGVLGDFVVSGAGGPGNVLEVAGALTGEGVEVEVFIDPEGPVGDPTVYPNPSLGDVYVGFDVDQGPVDVSLEIFDLGGQLLYNVVRSDLPEGVYRAPIPGEAFRWNTLDRSGNPVASGIYIAVLRKEGDQVSAIKFSIVR